MTWEKDNKGRFTSNEETSLEDSNHGWISMLDIAEEGSSAEWGSMGGDARDESTRTEYTTVISSSKRECDMIANKHGSNLVCDEGERVVQVIERNET